MERKASSLPQLLIRMPMPMLALLLCSSQLLTACATAGISRSSPDAELLHDELFHQPTSPLAVTDVFAMSPAMQRYAETTIRPAMRVGDPARALMKALEESGQLKLEYDASTTRDAAGAFEARAGNCLSLVIMTGAFARYFDLPLRYQEVFSTPIWSRSGSLELANGHVNLRLAHRPSRRESRYGDVIEDDGLTVDFVPSELASQYRSRPVSEAKLLGMYFNNRAVENLSESSLDEAYGWARASLSAVPTYTAAYNTLAVIYQRSGHPALAEQVLRHVLAVEPGNTVVLSNLISVLNNLGREQEAAVLTARLQSLEPIPPFHFFDLGVLAVQSGDYPAARDLFKRELQRAAYDADSHFWLGLVYLRLNDPLKAQQHLAAAMDNSATLQAKAIYGAKLSWLKAHS